MEKKEGHVVGGQKDSANELVSANTGWSAAAVSGFMAQCFVVASTVTLWKKKEIKTKKNSPEFRAKSEMKAMHNVRLHEK